MTQRPLAVLILLILASLACYSDSPLWPHDLTPAPPTPTPLPTPLPDQARLQIGDVAYAPASVTEAAFRLDMTRFPEPLKPDFSNRSPQSCSQDSIVTVLYSAVTPTGEIYQLIDCLGVVGWTQERRLLGPIHLVTGQRALTLDAGRDETGAYKIEASDPPYRDEDRFRQRLDCNVGETVDIIGMSGFSTGELYYKIRCRNPLNPSPVAPPNLGWVTPEALFGPVRFRNGEQAILPQGLAELPLLAAPDSDDVIATCEAGERIQITDTPVQLIQIQAEDELFYELSCAAGLGWASQDFLVGPVPYEIGDRVLITAPGVRNSAAIREQVAAQTALQDDPDAALEALETELDSESDASDLAPETLETPVFLEIPSVPLLAAAGAFSTEGQIGTCQDANVVTLLGFAGVDDELYAQIDCEGLAGWLPVDQLYGTVNYNVGDEVLLGERALIGFNQRGIFLSVELFNIEGSSGGASVIAGECVFDFADFTPTPATLTEVGYYRNALGQVVNVFYRARCLYRNGVEIEGWLNQDRIGE